MPSHFKPALDSVLPTLCQNDLPSRNHLLLMRSPLAQPGFMDLFLQIQLLPSFLGCRHMRSLRYEITFN